MPWIFRIHRDAMLRLGSAFRRAYDDYFATGSLRSRDHARPIWGDEWAEGSINCLWYPCNWRDVSDDELVLLIPSLVSLKPNGDHPDRFGPSRNLRRALIARLRWAVLALSSSANGESDAFERVLEVINQTKAMTAIDIRDWSTGEAECTEFYGDLAAELSTRRLSHRFTASKSEASSQYWIYELTVLACMDRLLCHSISTQDVSGSIGRDGGHYGIPEILLATIHSGLNGAYVYQQIAGSHELLTVGAWLGHLLRGRAAIMPDFIADYIVERFSQAPDEDNSAARRCDRLLYIYGDLTVGSRRLLKIARRVKANGDAAVVTPKFRYSERYSELLACTENFSGDVASRISLQPLD